MDAVRGPEPCPCCNKFHFHDKRNVLRMKDWADSQLAKWAKEERDCAAKNTRWVTVCCRRTVKVEYPKTPIVFCPECESPDTLAVPASGDDEPEISTGCSEMHGPGWKDLVQLEEKIDKSRTRDRAFRNDLFDFLEGLARGFPVKSDLCLNDLRKKYL